MTTFIVQCAWQMTGKLAVKADSEAEARQKAHDAPSLPDEGEYLADSFQVTEVEVDLDSLVCEHGQPLPEHPDYTGRCRSCDALEYADLVYDQWRDDHS